MTTPRWDTDGIREMTSLISEAVCLRTLILNGLRAANSLDVGVVEAFCRNGTRVLEKQFTDLEEKFLDYEKRVNKFLTEWLGPTVRFPDLSSQVSLTLYYYSLVAQKDAAGKLLDQLGGMIDDHRSRANNVLGIVLSTIAIAVSIVALWK